MALVKRLDKPLNLSQALQLFFDGKVHKLDLIITEGFKRENKPKIEITRSKISPKPICRPRGDNLIALVSDVKITTYKIPQFGLNDVMKIVDFIEKEFLCPMKRKR
jgi:molybdopterin-guanine dinucleotide biosynthesis protein B